MARLGMPQLSAVGLSEGWLLRECSAQHWSGLTTTFLAVRVSGGPLAAFREGDDARLHTRLTRLSRNRFHSSHRLRALGSAADVTVEMISARPAAARDEGESDPLPMESGLIDAERELRHRQREMRRSTDLAGGLLPVEAGRPYVHRPSPLSDVNDAGRLCFSTCHSIVDRAEWEWLSRPDTPPWTTSGRDIFFFADLNPGEAVEVVLRDVQKSRRLLRHRSQMFRVSDGRLMADVFTIKRAQP